MQEAVAVEIMAQSLATDAHVAYERSSIELAGAFLWGPCAAMQALTGG
jgi:hypothetical protein